MSEIGSPADQQVYLGVWTNWSQGKVFGSTITMSQYNGNLLIAFIALFVSFVGTSLWRVTSYALHRLFSTSTAQDGVYHQRQAILRNAANATDAVWDLTHILWNTRQSKRTYRRLLPSLTSASISVMAFAIAGIFSSKMATLTGSEVLLASPSCGMPNGNPGSNSDMLVIKQPWTAQRMTSAMNYAQRCYFANARDENCNTFVKPRLPSTTNWNASCPFDDKICLSPYGNIELDTGLVDSHFDLGYNGPDSKRMQYRRVMSCAPLKMEGYTDSFVYPSSVGNVSYRRYNYGPRLHKGGFNHTQMQPEISQDQLNMSSFKTSFGDYGVSYLQTYSFKGSLIPQVSEFQPIPAIHRGDADVSLVFLSAGNIIFTKPVDDPWYSAHVPLQNITATGNSKGRQELYMADSPASVLGCAIQYQQCISTLPEGKRCSQLGGLWETNQTISTETEWQFGMLQWIGTTFAESEVQYLVASLRAGSLTSKYSNIASLQGPLPENQWQLDVEQWHYATLAAAQASAIDYATGPGINESISQVWETPEDDDDVGKYFCRNQKIRSNQYLNFSVFGLAFTLVVGGLIILLNYVLPSLVQSIEKRKSGIGYSTLEWFSTGTLQLQRLAHEGAGYGSWSNCNGEIPIADPSDRLAVLDIGAPQCPRLRSNQVVHGNDEKFQFHSIDKVLHRQLSESTMQDESNGDAGSEKQSSEIKQTIVHTKTDGTLVDQIELSSTQETAVGGRPPRGR